MPIRTGVLTASADRSRSAASSDAPVVQHRHQRAVIAAGFGVLDHVAAVDDAGRALLAARRRPREDLLVVDPAAAAHAAPERRRAVDDAVVLGEVVGGVGLDDVGAELDGLAHESARSSLDVAVDV